MLLYPTYSLFKPGICTIYFIFSQGIGLKFIKLKQICASNIFNINIFKYNCILLILFPLSFIRMLQYYILFYTSNSFFSIPWLISAASANVRCQSEQTLYTPSNVKIFIQCYNLASICITNSLPYSDGVDISHLLWNRNTVTYNYCG